MFMVHIFKPRDNADLVFSFISFEDFFNYRFILSEIYLTIYFFLTAPNLTLFG